MLKVKLLSKKAFAPKRNSEGAGGYDLYATEDANILSDSRKLIKTDVAIAIPDGYVGIIKSRSSLAYTYKADVKAGVIDSDYRGNIGVLIHNENHYTAIRIKRGDKIAQMIILPYYKEEVKVVKNLDDTKRGEGSFGSTGK